MKIDNGVHINSAFMDLKMLNKGVKRIVFFLCLFVCQASLYASVDDAENIFLILALKISYFIEMNNSEVDKIVCFYDVFYSEKEKKIKTESVIPKKIKFKFIKNKVDVDDCYVIYITGRSMNAGNLKWISESEKIFLSNSPNFIKLGGVVGMKVEGKNIAIEVNNTLAKNKGYIISSKLLSIAEKIL